MPSARRSSDGRTGADATGGGGSGAGGASSRAMYSSMRASARVHARGRPSSTFATRSSAKQRVAPANRQAAGDGDAGARRARRGRVRAAAARRRAGSSARAARRPGRARWSIVVGVAGRAASQPGERVAAAVAARHARVAAGGEHDVAAGARAARARSAGREGPAPTTSTPPSGSCCRVAVAGDVELERRPAPQPPRRPARAAGRSRPLATTTFARVPRRPRRCTPSTRPACARRARTVVPSMHRRAERARVALEVRDERRRGRGSRPGRRAAARPAAG